MGVTQIDISYSSPGVKGRQIWGGLVPHGQIWRTGANEATTIAFSTDVQVEGKPLPAGKYALFTIPGRREVDRGVQHARATSGAPSTTTPEEDALRVEIAPREAPLLERMAFAVKDVTDTSAVVELRWEKIAGAVHRAPSTRRAWRAERAAKETVGGRRRRRAPSPPGRAGRSRATPPSTRPSAGPRGRSRARARRATGPAASMPACSRKAGKAAEARAEARARVGARRRRLDPRDEGRRRAAARPSWRSGERSANRVSVVQRRRAARERALPGRRGGRGRGPGGTLRLAHAIDRVSRPDRPRRLLAHRRSPC